MFAVGLQEPDSAKQGWTSDKPAPANNTSVAARARAGMKGRKTRGALEDGACGRVMADDDSGFIT